MLKIRKKQVSAFQPLAEAAFVRRVVDYLQQRHGSLDVELPSGKILVGEIPNKTMCQLVQNGITQARQYDMTWESSLTSFVVIMFISAPNFHQHPITNRILRDKSIEPNARVDRLLERVTAASWQAVKERSDPQAWGL